MKPTLISGNCHQDHRGQLFYNNNFSYYQFKNLILGAPFIKDEEETIHFIKELIKQKTFFQFLKKFQLKINLY